MAQTFVSSASLELLGFELVPKVLTSTEINELVSALGDIPGPGRRGVLKIPQVARLAFSPALLHLARSAMSNEPRPVCALYFDKSSTSNWAVSWHQDLTLAVKARAEVPGFGPWSVKDGVPHVQAPVQLIEQMLIIRLHLDDCDEANGALHVLAGSHKFGRTDARTIQGLRHECPQHLCPVNAGGAMLMRPLLLHCSRRSQSRRRRRVLHIEYAGFELPSPLEWHPAG